MAGSKSDYLENALLNGVLGGSAFSLPATVYLSLSTAAYSDAATGASQTEVSGGSYARVAVTNNNTNWPAASGGSKSSGAVFTFPTASAGWGTVQSFYINDAASNGNVLYGADLTANRTILNGDTASFASGAITVTES
jgi:hypothetical protein